MRGEQLKTIISHCQMQVINTHIPFGKSNRLVRSFGFRYKRGPLINSINQYITSSLSDKQYDLIWVDKAVYITKETTAQLRQKTKTLVHFTPDPAFTFHQSHHFKASLGYYDYAITTKSFEQVHYLNHLSKEKIILTTQGFNANTHQSQIEFSDKKEGVLFIGHCESERDLVLQRLIDSGIKVVVAGIKWEQFAKRNQNNPLLTYLGKGIYGADYAMALSTYQFSWGALSKWIPELHTTRTFEIPACGTALITERNAETSSFFNENEAVFYNTPEEMVERIKYYQNHPHELETLTNKGRERVIRDGRDYMNILKKVLAEMGFSLNTKP